MLFSMRFLFVTRFCFAVIVAVFLARTVVFISVVVLEGVSFGARKR